MAIETPFSSFQNEIYLAGLSGEHPPYPVDAANLEERAREAMSPEAYGYVVGGASSEATVRANRDAFERHRIVPRMLRRVEERDLRTEVLGTSMPAPLLLAPIGVQTIVHPDGELAAARAAASQGVPYVLSSASSHSIEAIAEVMGDAPRWFQLYWPRDPELCASFVARAERAGYGAIVVTLDTSILAWRPRDLARGYLPFLRGEGIALYTSDPVFRSRLDRPPEEDIGAAVLGFLGVFGNPALGWDDLSFLREHTRLPILLKGILHPDDAHEAVARGIDGIVVSNHGGRQVDGAIGALDALGPIAEAVGASVPVLFDSGVRTGADAFKALALGARAVLLGRPYMWGLALGGEDGVRHVLRCFLADLDLTLALSGHARPAEIGRASITAAP